VRVHLGLPAKSLDLLRMTAVQKRYDANRPSLAQQFPFEQPADAEADPLFPSDQPEIQPTTTSLSRKTLFPTRPRMVGHT
jgi:hypothetical protein